MEMTSVQENFSEPSFGVPPQEDSAALSAQSPQTTLTAGNDATKDKEYKFLSIHLLNENMMLNQLWFRCGLSAVYLIIGITVMNYWKGWTILIATYFSVITFTTIGALEFYFRIFS